MPPAAADPPDGDTADAPPGDHPASPRMVARAEERALADIAEAGDLDALRDVKRRHVGDQSPLALANRTIGRLPVTERAAAGQRVGRARGAVQAAFEQRREALEAAREARVLRAEAVDVTLPVDGVGRGAQHPLSVLRTRIEDIFVALGWEVVEGPELETEWFNFDALNIAPDHPARTESDTLFVSGAGSGLVLRTHTSPVQVRTMLERTPPIWVICPGRTFRSDELDATHTPVFSQVEGLAVDEGLTMADLKGVLDHFASSMFGAGLRTRLRPSFFPFTEPSAEVDVQCFACGGTSAQPGMSTCRTCSSEGWIEWGGCGMVNPRVLTACGIDPDRYRGFAFGMGLERTLMFRHNVVDMRDIVEGDVRLAYALGRER